MKSLLLIVFFLVGFISFTHGQVISEAAHKIIYQLADGNVDVHDKFLRQLENVLNAAPNAQIEVVTHGMGIDLMRNEENPYTERINALVEKGVVFMVCENTMSQRKLQKTQFLGLSEFIPAGILEIVMKQEQGWIYIKAGI
ncbi:DsrE family protein [Mongoliitalea daihaiensis]|uniref:DsrE family protein n=1 Tax=Mongoliitalea daihaiensis TaxID=2782006 RepID=UPI001F387021|nr:DsrE family protein [Mongoliitalea daihaiensis]UJP64855.1 DsrE family protein [Mongoliitalea daihaiensis]